MLGQKVNVENSHIHFFQNISLRMKKQINEIMEIKERKNGALEFGKKKSKEFGRLKERLMPNIYLNLFLPCTKIST